MAEMAEMAEIQQNIQQNIQQEDDRTIQNERDGRYGRYG